MISSATETLEQCSLKLQVLSGKIDRIRSLSNNTSPVQLVAPPPTPTSAPESPSMPPKRAPARCHECHGPITGYHQGYPHGLGVCQLEHYDLCAGHILERDRGGHAWSPCPEDYQPPNEHGHEQDYEPTDDNEFVSDYESYEDTVEHSPGSEDVSSKKDTGLEDGVSKSAAEKNSEEPYQASKSNPTPNAAPKVLSVNTDGKTEADLLIEAELAELAFAEKEEKKLQEVANIRKRKEQSLQNIARLSRQAQGEGARGKTSINSNIEMFRAANFQPSASRKDSSNYTGPVMPRIRQDSFTRDNVEVMMDEVYDIPAFSRASHTRRIQPKPRLKQTRSTVASSLPDSRQEGIAREIVQPSVMRPGEPLFRWVMKRDQYGREYRELVEVSPERPPPIPRQVINAEPGWYYDGQTGRMYRGQSPAHNTDPVKVVNSHHHVYLDSRVGGHTPDSQPHRADVQHTPAVVRRDVLQGERFPGFVPLTANQSEDREGKIPLSIASHARNLPMEYARSANSKNMNFALFMYGAVHELHSSRIGITPVMQRGVLEAKLQHLLNVIHVTCLNATAVDFKPVAWSVGRTYHNLVQAKVDSGREGWTDFDSLHRGSPHAAEMIAAEREHRVALTTKVEKVNVKKTEKKDEKPPCTTWNDYEEEGKCKYEAEHPGEKCNRSHYCSYCKKKYPSNRTQHQARFCKRKLEDDK